MAKRIIDLTLSVTAGVDWVQWPRRVVGQDEPRFRIEPVSTIEKSGFFVQKFEMTTQSYTHIDAPNHKIPGGIGIDEIPLECLIGEATIMDMSYKKAGEAVTGSDLESSGVEVKKGDIAVIRTGWTDRAWGTEKFWLDTIHLSEDGCDWLIDKGIKALAVDFYNEIKPFSACSVCGSLRPLDTPYVKPKEMVSPNHHKFLRKGIVLIENCVNLDMIRKPRVTLICLPLKLKGADGAPARVIAIEED